MRKNAKNARAAPNPGGFASPRYASLLSKDEIPKVPVVRTGYVGLPPPDPLEGCALPARERRFPPQALNGNKCLGGLESVLRRQATPGASASWLTGVDSTPDPDRTPQCFSVRLVVAPEPRAGLDSARRANRRHRRHWFRVRGRRVSAPREGPAMPIPWPIDPHKAVRAEEGAGAKRRAPERSGGAPERERRAGEVASDFLNSSS